ncbi:uncharacterized protein LOC111618693 [Centruroides sculpturatus]|uniref:uncharacterized protein LOC111618693 n=1 Tax=Centruroides sculpturatus TaxID=218467 RepID=UPI000C6E22B2|nr:uncharacterized protein LOC111618693 [Centruroides sculpturatus]
MELTQRCLNVHNVLRAQKSFLDPHVSRSDFVKEFGASILSLAKHLKEEITNKSMFRFAQLYLVFENHLTYPEFLNSKRLVTVTRKMKHLETYFSESGMAMAYVTDDPSRFFIEES